MSYTYEEHIKYKIERELEHLAWLKRNMPHSKKLLLQSKDKIDKLITELALTSYELKK